MEDYTVTTVAADGTVTVRDMTPEEIAFRQELAAAFAQGAGQDPIAQFRAAIDGHVEATARGWDYNSAAHLASYIASTVPAWAAEAQAFVAWRDAVWIAALQSLAAIQSGQAAPPASPAEFVSTLPAITRPAA